MFYSFSNFKIASTCPSKIQEGRRISKLFCQNEKKNVLDFYDISVYVAMFLVFQLFSNIFEVNEMSNMSLCSRVVP